MNNNFVQINDLRFFSFTPYFLQGVLKKYLKVQITKFASRFTKQKLALGPITSIVGTPQVLPSFLWYTLCKLADVQVFLTLEDDSQNQPMLSKTTESIS